jgi:hypothetical protein
MDGTVKVLKNDEAAARIGVSPNTLKLWRHQGKGPPFIKYGASKQAGVGYLVDDVDAWNEARKFSSTSAYSEAGRRNVKAQVSRSAEASA